MAAAFILFSLILFLIFLFIYVFILPVGFLLQCAKSEELSSTQKSLWIVGMLVTWPIAAYVYGLLYSGKKIWKRVSAGALLLTALVIVGALIFIPKFISLEQKQMDLTLEKIEKLAMPGTPPDGREILKGALESLKNEVGEMSLIKMEQAQVGINLHELLVLHMKDDELSPAEYQSWLEKYRIRRLLNSEALEQFISETR